MRLRYLLTRAPYTERSTREYAGESSLFHDTLALHRIGETDAAPIIGYGTVRELLATWRATRQPGEVGYSEYETVPPALVEACTRSYGAI